jgi:hypothetical protein
MLPKNLIVSNDNYDRDGYCLNTVFSLFLDGAKADSNEKNIHIVPDLN